MQIAIDGPASSGKSTVAKIIAKKLKFLYVDTGAMYRSVTLYGIKKKVNLDNEVAVKELLKSMKYDCRLIDNEQHYFVNDIDVSEEIRSPVVAKNVSQVSSYPSVREYLSNLQRKIANKKNVVMDGRDIGTVILPHADFKFFLFAKTEIRAKRRFLENKNKGINSNLDELIEAISRRDKLDEKQSKRADDAIIIDTSNMNINEVVSTIMNKIRR